MSICLQVYLVDFGLAYRYSVDGVHKEYKEDPRKAHDGTIEFTSRDAHKGVGTLFCFILQNCHLLSSFCAFGIKM